MLKQNRSPYRRIQGALETVVWVSLFILIMLSLLALIITGLQPMVEKFL